MACPVLSPSHQTTSSFPEHCRVFCLTEAEQDKLTAGELGGVLKNLTLLPTVRSSPGFVL